MAALLQQRRMVRSFSGEAVSPDQLHHLAELALLSPTAGNSAGIRMNVLSRAALPGYFAVATDEAWRNTSRRAPGLMRAGGAVVVSSRPQDYLARYAETDKAQSQLSHEENWDVPYWFGDAGMATMSLLLLLEEAGLDACLWGNFRHEAAVMSYLGCPDERLFATVLLGHRDGLDYRSASLDRSVPRRADRVRRLGE